MRIIVVGLNHNIQRRHPDEDNKVTTNRARFAECLAQAIRDEGISLVGEEAGDDAEVAAVLQREVDGLYAIAPGLRAPQVPVQPTVGRQTAQQIGCRHVDIRPPGEKTTEEEYENGMVERALAAAGPNDTVLILVGDNHRESLERRFVERGHESTGETFDEFLGRD